MNAFVRHLLVAGAGTALMVVTGAPAGAQSQDAAASNAAPAQRSIQLVQAAASLEHALDAKKAKQGEAVTAKLEKDVSIPQQQSLPRNTVLEGHVDQVQPSEHKGDSTVVVTFDKAKLKGGQEVSIKATVMAIAQPAYLQSASAGDAGGGMPATGGGGMPSGAPQSSAGGAPGASGGAAASTPAPQPAPVGSPNQPSSMQQQGQGQRNGVPGVTLQSDIHQPSSATFTAKGKNVHLPDGTLLDVALAVVPAGTHVQ